jgi:hypothetical protein
MVVAIVFVHHRIMLGEKEHVATHGIGEAFERGQIADVLMIRFEDCGDPVFAHEHLHALDALPAHAVGVKPLLPIRRFRAEG